VEFTDYKGVMMRDGGLTYIYVS